MSSSAYDAAYDEDEETDARVRTRERQQKLDL
jgi:hypothetical protein